jgi:hypothetical protein
MKTILRTVCALLASGSVLLADPSLITFDDLSTPWNPADGSYSQPVPSGYGGLQWGNFEVLNAVSFPYNPSGYLNGIVSAPNVAVNWNALPSSIYDTAGLFDLNSLNLTAAWVDGLRVEIQGFRDGSIVYDNTYTLCQASSRLFELNYLGVSRVQFLACSQFGLDNVIATIPDTAGAEVPEPSTAGILLAGAAVLRMGFKRSQLAR